MDPETTHMEPMAEEEEPLFSNLDLFLFSLIVGLIVYWFMSRKKPEPIPDFKKLDTVWVCNGVYLSLYMRQGIICFLLQFSVLL